MNGAFFGDFSLYIHIPYCVSKCAYCDFLSFSDKGSMSYYFDALCAEIREKGRKYKDRVVTAVYIGGGTPSIAHAYFPKLKDAVFSSFRVAEGAEISVECNPESVTEEFIFAAKDLGVNRVSVGVQSLSDRLLRRIGRAHDRATALRALNMLTQAFPRVNADVMVGLPDQTEADVLETTDRLLGYDLSHISCYSLILEKGTHLYKEARRGEFAPDEDRAVDMYDLVRGRLSDAGYERYEISNFAKKGEECRYNLSVWQYAEYLGLGLGASSFMKGEKSDTFARRYRAPRDLARYISGGRPVVRRISTGEAKKEFVMLGLRLREGLSLANYRALFGSDLLTDFAENLPKVSAYLKITKNSVAILPKYIYVSNSIISDLI